MQEILSRTDDQKARLCGKEFYELRLYESGSAGELVYCVREARAWWDSRKGQISWDDPQIAAFSTPQEAEKQYAEQRHILVGKGFISSDMDLF